MSPDKGAWLWLEGKGTHFAKIWACGLTAMIKVVIPNCLYSILFQSSLLHLFGFRTRDYASNKQVKGKSRT